MSVESTTQTMNSYLETLSQRGDFGQHFTEDVLWTTMETGQEIRGREAVRDSILAMHAQIFDAHPQLRSITIGDGTAALEADFIGVHTGEFAGIPAPASTSACPTASSMT